MSLVPRDLTRLHRADLETIMACREHRAAACRSPLTFLEEPAITWLAVSRIGINTVKATGDMEFVLPHKPGRAHRDLRVRNTDDEADRLRGRCRTRDL